jgi:glycosyltransferase involved in cell wall biosynthesis
MLRVRNEEEFLEPSVLSIAELVDEIVLIDNASTDGTPDVIETLRRQLPDKLHTFDYPHTIARVGKETWELTDDRGDDSPGLSSTYYNFALSRCTMPFVLKWDGDMVALDRLRTELEEWRTSGLPVMAFHGVNVHPDRRHRIVARSDDRDALLARLEVPALPKWVTTLTYDFPEPRLFPRRGARYESRMRWTQRLELPDREMQTRRVEGPCFLHLKFCKRAPLSNYSADLAEVIASNVAAGPELESDERHTLATWELTL